MLDIIQNYWLTLLIGQYPAGPLGGVALTLLLALLGLVLCFPLALLLAIGRVCPYKPFNYLCRTIIDFVRAIPFLMLIFWSYFAIPKLFGNASISPFWTLIGALVIYESAYLAEVIRSSIEAISKGQTEAARSLGANYWLTMRKIILPQALFNAIPSITSQFVSTIKETSLGYVISVHELTYAGSQIMGMEPTKPLQVFTLIALMYFIICFSLSLAMRYLDRRIHKQRTTIATTV